MRILHLDAKPIHRIAFLNAAKRGGVESQALPIMRGRVDALPHGVDALLLTSDLQGVVSSWRKGGESHLLGEELVEVMVDLADQGLVPSPGMTGVVLAGDLYAVPAGNKRGATGDVRPVWQAFAEQFQWVVGVAGNHDEFGTPKEQARLCALAEVHLLDGDVVDLGSFKVGGIGHIVGDPMKKGRVSERDFLAGLDMVLTQRPDMLVMHEGPRGARDQRGNEQIAERVVAAGTPLTVCGHVHWDECLAELAPGVQVLNVDARTVLLTLG